MTWDFDNDESADNTTLYVNMFVPSTLNWIDRRIVVRQATSFPYADTTRLTVTGSGQFDMKIRVPRWATRGFFESRHNLTFSGNLREKLFGDYASSVGFTFVARSGRPYSLTFNASDAFGTRTGSDNALLYIPSGVDDPNISPESDMEQVGQLIEFVNRLDCAKGYGGRTIKRNTCTNDWYYDLDLRFAYFLERA